MAGLPSARGIGTRERRRLSALNPDEAERVRSALDVRIARYQESDTFNNLHDVISDPDDLPGATAELREFILGGLGFSGAIESHG